MIVEKVICLIIGVGCDLLMVYVELVVMCVVVVGWDDSEFKIFGVMVMICYDDVMLVEMGYVYKVCDLVF